MSDDRLPRGLLAFVVVAFVVWLLALALVVSMSGCSRGDEQGSPESSEFSETQAGAPRFSRHATGLMSTYVIVDHETGCQYLCRFSGGGMTQLTDADGSPLLVAEAGS